MAAAISMQLDRADSHLFKLSLFGDFHSATTSSLIREQHRDRDLCTHQPIQPEEMKLIHIIWALASLMMVICEAAGGMTGHVRDGQGEVLVVDVSSDAIVGDLRVTVGCKCRRQEFSISWPGVGG
mgnify:CR=1 FL=1